MCKYHPKKTLVKVISRVTIFSWTTWLHQKYNKNLVSAMVRSGMTAQVACDRIYQTYGNNLSVTQILKRLKTDHIERGGHPALNFPLAE